MVQVETIVIVIIYSRTICNLGLRTGLYLSSYEKYFYRKAAGSSQVSWLLMSIKVTGSREREAARPIQSRESSHEITVTPQRKTRRWNCNQFCINNPSSLSRNLLCEYLQNTFTKLEIKCELSDIVLPSLVIDTDMKIYEVSRLISLRKYRHWVSCLHFKITSPLHVLTVNNVILRRTIFMFCPMNW